MALRILFATHGYKPAYNIGGPIHSVGELAEGLVRRGHEVRVFTTNSNLTEDLDVPTDVPIEINGVEVWYFRRVEPLQRLLPFVSYVSRSIGFLFCPAMRKALDEVVPCVDVVHTHIPFVYPTLAAGRAALRHSKPLFYHQRGVFDPQRLRFRSLKKTVYINLLEKPLMKRAAGLFALTDAEKASYAAIGVTGPCHVVPNGIDVSKFRDVPRTDCVARIGVPEDATVVLFMGRLHPVKGADVLVDAFLRIYDRRPRAVLIMAGPDEWGERQRLQGKVDAAGASSRVMFVGPVAGQQKLDLLARADVFCLPSEAEGFSMAVLEALASSTAVLLSPGCHFDEVVEAGAGLVVEKSEASLADALAQMLEHPERLRAMGARGRDFVSASYDWNRVISITERIYLEACGKQERAGHAAA